MQFYGFEAHVLDKNESGNLFEIKFGNQLRIDALQTQFKLLQINNSLTFPINYQNNLTYTTNDLYLSAKYRFKFNNVSIYFYD